MASCFIHDLYWIRFYSKSMLDSIHPETAGYHNTPLDEKLKLLIDWRNGASSAHCFFYKCMNYSHNWWYSVLYESNTKIIFAAAQTSTNIYRQVCLKASQSGPKEQNTQHANIIVCNWKDESQVSWLIQQQHHLKWDFFKLS